MKPFKWTKRILKNFTNIDKLIFVLVSVNALLTSWFLDIATKMVITFIFCQQPQTYLCMNGTKRLILIYIIAILSCPQMFSFFLLDFDFRVLLFLAKKHSSSTFLLSKSWQRFRKDWWMPHLDMIKYPCDKTYEGRVQDSV